MPWDTLSADTLRDVAFPVFLVASLAGCGPSARGGAVAVDAAVAATPPFPTIVRVVNDGPGDYQLTYYPNFGCGVGLAITGPAAPIDQPTSIEGSDRLCPCATCQPDAARSPRCSIVDFVCDDGFPLVIPSGGARDFAWDGTVTAWRTDVPACASRCSDTYVVPAGDSYRFTLNVSSAFANTQPGHTDTPLPAPGRVVVLHVN